MLLLRYSLIRFSLVGKFIKRKKDSKDDIIAFIQVFVKAVEHLLGAAITKQTANSAEEVAAELEAKKAERRAKNKARKAAKKAAKLEKRQTKDYATGVQPSGMPADALVGGHPAEGQVVGARTEHAHQRTNSNLITAAHARQRHHRGQHHDTGQGHCGLWGQRAARNLGEEQCGNRHQGS